MARSEQISDAAKRAAALTRQLLMFSRKQVIQTKILDLNLVLQNLANMLLRLLGEDVSLEAEYCPELPADRRRHGNVGANRHEPRRQFP